MSLQPKPLPDLITVIDLETTGLDASRDRILEIGAVRLERGRVTKTWETLVKPGADVTISRSSFAVHGIDMAMVADAPPLRQALETLIEFLGESPWAAHHAPFDAGFLRASLAREGLPTLPGEVFDTLEMAREAFPDLRSHKLETVCRLLGRAPEGLHRAALDAGHLAAVLPSLWHEWQQRLCWREGQHQVIEQVAKRHEHVGRLIEALQAEQADLRRTLHSYFAVQPDARIPLDADDVLVQLPRQAWEYDESELLPLLADWEMKEALLKLDRQRLDRWLQAGRFSTAQEDQLRALRKVVPGPPRLGRSSRDHLPPPQSPPPSSRDEWVAALSSPE